MPNEYWNPNPVMQQPFQQPLSHQPLVNNLPDYHNMNDFQRTQALAGGINDVCHTREYEVPLPLSHLPDYDTMPDHQRIIELHPIKLFEPILPDPIDFLPKRFILDNLD